MRKIVEAGDIKQGDTILEIGPGRGALTEKLLEKAGLVIAVEKDRELVEFLKEKFYEQIKNKKLILIQDDILNFNTEQNIHRNILRSYKIIANIPYNITGAIFKKFLGEVHQPERMILMVQHEVAKRIVAGGKKESILSISVKAYGEPKLLMKVSARYFNPQPKVDSAVIVVKNISRRIFRETAVNEEKFWKIVKTGFAHKRKKLGSNLKNVIFDKKVLTTDLGNKRAEDLTLLDWVKLAKTL